MDNIDYLRNFNYNDDLILYPVVNTIRYRNRPSISNHVSYPGTSVDIDYNITTESVGEISIKILDDENNLINSYKSIDNNENIESYEK